MGTEIGQHDGGAVPSPKAHKLFLVGKALLQDLVASGKLGSGLSDKRIDELGIDLCVGKVTIANRNICEKFETGNKELTIFPGDTLEIKTVETIALPPDIYATGSPKMGLLKEGLWGHGGKTDPCFSGPLYLYFHHVGVNPIQIQKGQPVFHLIFYQCEPSTCASSKSWTGEDMKMAGLLKSAMDWVWQSFYIIFVMLVFLLFFDKIGIFSNAMLLQIVGFFALIPTLIIICKFLLNKNIVLGTIGSLVLSIPTIVAVVNHCLGIWEKLNGGNK